MDLWSCPKNILVLHELQKPQLNVENTLQKLGSSKPTAYKTPHREMTCMRCSAKHYARLRFPMETCFFQVTAERNPSNPSIDRYEFYVYLIMTVRPTDILRMITIDWLGGGFLNK